MNLPVLAPSGVLSHLHGDALAGEIKK